MILIIAYGNDLREDDGAGLVLAARLEAIWRAEGCPVERLVVHQLTPELALRIADPQVSALLFADTRAVDATEPGALPTAAVRLRRIRPADHSSPSMAHHLQPEVLLAYAELLAPQRLPPTWLVTVPGVRFGFGTAIGEVASGAIDRALADDGALLDLVARLSACHRPLAAEQA